MRDLASIASFVAIACGVSIVALAALVPSPSPTIDLQQYQTCKRIHPERYCAITYAGLQK